MKLSRKDLENFERLKADWCDITRTISSMAKTDRHLLSTLVQRGWRLPEIRRLLSKIERSHQTDLKKANRNKRKTRDKAKRKEIQKLNPIARMSSVGRARPIQGGAPGLKSQK